jgi:mRNA interferase MazF
LGQTLQKVIVAMPFSQRDIVFVQFPFTDLAHSKLRPALIISSDFVNQTEDFICLQITSKEFDDGLFFRMEDESLSVPLKLKSGIRVHKVFTVNKSRIVHKISSLNPDIFRVLETRFSKLVF